MEFVRFIQAHTLVANVIIGVLLGLGYWIICLAFDEEEPHGKR